MSESKGTPSKDPKAAKRAFFMKGRSAPLPPPNKGSKDIPIGAPNCLKGKSFVITGTLDSLEREEAEDLIKRYGGVIRVAVSGKTSYIVVGIEPGTSKLEKAKHHKTPQIDEDGLLELLRKSNPEQLEYDDNGKPITKRANEDEDMLSSDEATTPTTPARTVVKPAQLAATSTSAPVSNPQKQTNRNTELWSEKYRPTTLSELVGNASNVQTLLEWLTQWDKNFLKPKPEKKPAARTKKADGEETTKPTKKQTASDQIRTMKAALISGVPGIGKTSAARIACIQAGFEPIEFNASDTRNQKALDLVVKEILNTRTLSEFFKPVSQKPTTGAAKAKPKKPCIIMDEVDGMSRGDRGGIAELIKFIKDTKVPIICICNDRYSQKLKTLLKYCVDIRFTRPTKLMISKRVAEICKAEGFSIDTQAIDVIVESVHNDIRSVLNNLQMWSRAQASRVTYDKAKAGTRGDMKTSEQMSIFDIVQKFFQPHNRVNPMTITDYTNLFYADSELVPLFIQQNYININPSEAKSDLEKLERISKAADSISDGDIINYSIRSKQNWSLSNTFAVASAIRPAFMIRGNYTRVLPYDSYFTFPSVLGKWSTTKKNIGLIKGIQKASSAVTSGTSTDILTDYLPLWRRTFTQPLIDEGKAGIDTVIETMDKYNLSREDYDTVLEMGTFSKSAVTDITSKIPTVVKSAFTRQYNKMHKTISKSKSSRATKSMVGAEDVTRPEDVVLDGEDEDDDSTTGSDDSDSEKSAADDLKVKKSDFIAKSNTKRIVDVDAILNSTKKRTTRASTSRASKPAATKAKATPAKKATAPVTEAKKKSPPKAAASTSRKRKAASESEDEESDIILDKESDTEEEVKRPAKRAKTATTATTKKAATAKKEATVDKTAPSATSPTAAVKKGPTQTKLSFARVPTKSAVTANVTSETKPASVKTSPAKKTTPTKSASASKKASPAKKATPPKKAKQPVSSPEDEEDIYSFSEDSDMETQPPAKRPVTRSRK